MHSQHALSLTVGQKKISIWFVSLVIERMMNNIICSSIWCYGAGEGLFKFGEMSSSQLIAQGWVGQGRLDLRVSDRRLWEVIIGEPWRARLAPCISLARRDQGQPSPFGSYAVVFWNLLLWFCRKSSFFHSRVCLYMAQTAQHAITIVWK